MSKLMTREEKAADKSVGRLLWSLSTPESPTGKEIMTFCEAYSDLVEGRGMSVPFLAEAYGNASSRQREEIVSILAKIGQRSDAVLEIVKRSLGSAHGGERLAAARAIRDLGLVQECVYQVAEMMWSSLDIIPHPLYNIYADCLDPHLIEQEIKVVGAGVFNAPFALALLIKQKPKQARQVIIEEFMRTKEPSADMVKAVGCVGEPEDWELLMPFLVPLRSDEKTQVNAVEGLKNLKATEALNELQSVMRSGHYETRIVAVNAVGALARGLPEDEKKEIAVRVVGALSFLFDSTSTRDLSYGRRLMNEVDRTVRLLLIPPRIEPDDEPDSE